MGRSRAGAPSTHLVVEPSDYVLRNAGDMAMLEVAVTRLALRWPGSSIFVLSDAPASFPLYRPNVVPWDSAGRRAWLAGRSSAPEAQAFVARVATARLVAVAGMGGITDAFPDYALGVLATLELAISRGVPRVMFGQGIGPLEAPALRERAAAILPHVDLIALREKRAGLPLLLSLGVASNRIVPTGDDAIELAYPPHVDRPGTGLGVNLRAASYSEVGAEVIDQVRRGVHRSARRHRVPLVPIPISLVPGEEDAGTIHRLTDGYEATAEPEGMIIGARGVIEQVLRCHVVVSGSYHAGVFALASGIPVVAVARSQYYVDKFLGLADQFGDGCEVVIAGDQDIGEAVEGAIERLWPRAEQLRPELLAAAAHQVRASRAAYARAAELVEDGKP